MISRQVLYKKCFEFLEWSGESIEHPDMGNFLNGMRLIADGVSADLDKWLYWEKSVPEEVPEEEALSIFKKFLEHWIEKDQKRVLKRIIYMLDPEDMDYNEEALKMWNTIIDDKNENDG